jgi:hypothetical protein
METKPGYSNLIRVPIGEPICDEPTSDKEQLAAWMIANSFTTGHGDTTADLLKELTGQVAELRGQLALFREAFAIRHAMDNAEPWESV